MKLSVVVLLASGLLTSGARADSVIRVMVVGGKLEAQRYYAINLDCSSMGNTTLRVTSAPQHGTITMRRGKGFPVFSMSNPRHDCNTRKVDSMFVDYRPEAGFTGTDYFTIDAFFPNGVERADDYQITVK
jgi:hypothetical protein